MSSLSKGASAGLLVGLLVLCFAVAAVGGVSTTAGVRDWYPLLDKPPWTPPNWAFGPVWTFLYTAMAVALWDAVRRSPSAARGAIGLFAVQLALNALWSPVFFAWQATGLGLVLISALWLAIAALIRVYAPLSRMSAGLTVPYLLWITIAWSLNAWIWWFNP